MENSPQSAEPSSKPDTELAAARQRYAGRKVRIDYGDGRKVNAIVGTVWRSAETIRAQLIFAPNVPRAVDLSFLEHNATVLPTARVAGAADGRG